MSAKAAKVLTDARKAKGWTQAEAAAALGKKLSQTYSSRQYSKLEDGNFPKYKREVVTALDDIFGINLEGLIYEHSGKEPEQNVPRVTTEEISENDDLKVAIRKLSEATERHSVIDDRNSKNIERLIALLEMKYNGYDPDLPIPGTPGTETGRKKANSKAG